MTYLDLYGYNHVLKYDKNFKVLGDVKLNKATDNHGQLDIQVDMNGRLHLIGGGHTDYNNYYYLERTENSFTFDSRKLSVIMTYPKLYCNGTDMWIYYRDSLKVSSNEDRLVLVKSTITTLDIDFSNKEIITVTGGATRIPGYGQTSLFNGNEFVLSSNWFNVTTDKSPTGFFIRKNLITGNWSDVNNNNITMPIPYTYNNFSGEDFRQSQIAYGNNSYYFMKSEMLQNKVTLCKVNTSFTEKNITLPQNLFVNQLKYINNNLYCLATNKNNGDVVLYKSNDEFLTYSEVLIGNCGTTHNWTSSTMNIENNKIKIRLLVNNSNLELIVFNL